MPIVQHAARRLYQCDSCQRVAEWDAGWCWHGSWRQLDDQGTKDTKPIITICSAACRVQMVADGTIPSEGIDDSGNVIDPLD